MIFRSPYPDVAIPSIPLTRFVLEQALSRGDKPALIDGPSGRTITYAQLVAAIPRVASSLARRGLRKGDVCAIYSPNLPEYAVAFHAVALAGGVNTTVNPLYTAEELAAQLRDSGAAYLVTVPPLAARALDAARAVGLREVFVFGEAEGATPFAALLEGDGQFTGPEIDPREDLVALPYSSGTTGLPKGVMLTHYNLVANLCQIDGAVPLTGGDVVVGALPFYHIYGMVLILNLGLYKGATIVTLPRFDFEQFLQVVQDYGVTRAALVPPIILALGKHPAVDAYDLSSLKDIDSGAAPLSDGVARACGARVGCQVRQGYGMTETSPVTHVSPADPARVKLAAVGHCIGQTECKLVDLATGAELGPHQDGEVCIRGPQVMKGYLNQPDATAAMIDAEGWLHTGDIGYADDEGYLYIVDRAKELIKYNAYQVAPAELEAILLSHPAVADAAVIPSRDDEAGEVPKAYVVLKGTATADEIISFVAERVAPYKKIRRLEFIDQVPKSAAGKILRRVLIERDRAATP